MLTMVAALLVAAQMATVVDEAKVKRNAVVGVARLTAQGMCCGPCFNPTLQAGRMDRSHRASAGARGDQRVPLFSPLSANPAFGRFARFARDQRAKGSHMFEETAAPQQGGSRLGIFLEARLSISRLSFLSSVSTVLPW